MRPHPSLRTVTLLVAAATLDAQAPSATRPLVLVHATLIDGTGAAPLRDATIVVEHGRITRIGTGRQPVPVGADSIDVAGRYVLPGLIDAHTHIASTAAMRRALESGVTTVRSANTPHYEDVGLRALVRRGVLAGPEMLAAGVFVTPYLGETALADPRLAEYAGAVLTPAQLRGVVRVNLDRGVDVIKTRATERAGLQPHVGLDGGIAARIDDLAATDVDDLAHLGTPSSAKSRAGLPRTASVSPRRRARPASSATIPFAPAATRSGRPRAPCPDPGASP